MKAPTTTLLGPKRLWIIIVNIIIIIIVVVVVVVAVVIITVVISFFFGFQYYFSKSPLVQRAPPISCQHYLGGDRHANYYLGGDRVTICGLRWALEPLATTKSKPVPSVP